MTMMIILLSFFSQSFLKNSEGVTVIFQDCEDTYINAKSTESNYNNVPYLWLNDADKNRILMKFNLSSIPRTARILSAELGLYEDSHRGHRYSLDPFIMPVLESWNKDSVNWNTRDEITPWTEIGGYFDKWEVCFFPSEMMVNPVNTLYTADITSLVQYWVDGSFPNYGMLFSAFRIGSDTSYRFISSEGPQDFRPKLKIVYTDSGSLTLPDTFLHPEIIKRADSHVYQHMKQDRTMTMNDIEDLGAKVFWVPTGSLNFGILDPWIDDAHSRGMTVVLTVPLSKSVDELYEYAKSAAAHFKGKVQWYNAHGEVNNSLFAHHNTKYIPEVVVKKVKTIYDAVKTEDPEAKIALAMLGSTNPVEYIKECLEYGLANWTDMWGNGIWISKGQSIRDYRNKSRIVKLALDEGMKAGHIINYQEQGMMKADESDPDNIKQAKVIAQKTVINHYVGMLPNAWYKLYDLSKENFQLISDDYKTKYKGFYALKYLNQYLNPSKYCPIRIGITTTPADFFKFAFKASDTDVVLAVWNAQNVPTNTFDTGISSDITFLDYGIYPVQIFDPITGEIVDSNPKYVIESGKVVIKNVEIRDYPRLIILKGGQISKGFINR